MKTLNIPGLKSIAAIICMVLGISFVKTNQAVAQLPDCLSGTIMYAAFNDSISNTGGTPLDSLEIRPVNYATGNVGALMGGRRYWIRKQLGGTWYHGASALAVDFVTSRFYVMTQMGNPGQKDIVAINTAGGTTTVVGGTPSSLDNYHFVKMASHPTNGYIYAIGVIRDTGISGMPANSNPIIRFPACITVGCATAGIQLLGYFPSTGVFRNWELFNGDIAFDVYGNMFFATAAYARVAGSNRYTDARLIRVNAVDLPVVAGTGVIPATLIADYNTLDSTVINGVAFDPGGNLYMSTRRYNGPQNPPLPTFNSLLYSTPIPGTATLIPGFVRPTPGTSVGDLASCYFPTAVLATNRVRLTGQYTNGSTGLRWEVNNNTAVAYYEIQSGNNGNDFETVGRVEVSNPQKPDQQYSFSDPQEQNGKAKYYRIRQVNQDGMRYYSNVLKVSLGKFSISGKVKPNPFTNFVDLAIELKSASAIHVRILDQNGRTLLQRQFEGHAGQNSIKISEVQQYKTGIYFMEVSVENEVVREKIIKQ